MKRRLAAGVFVLATMLAFSAQAEDSIDRPSLRPSPPPENVLSIQLVSLLANNVQLQYERFLRPPRVSFVTGLGFRSSGGPETDVFESSFGVEGRIWLIGKAPFSRFERAAMVGPYIGVRLDSGLTKVSQDGHVLGTSIRISEAIMLGVRFAFAKRFELTPSLGGGLRTDIDPRGRLALWTRGEIFRLGLTAGVMF
jgi:hypothetical protein